jgi:hypothetical protein
MPVARVSRNRPMRAHRSRAWSCAMNFAIQFLDGSRAVIFPNGVMSRNIPHTARAIELTQDVRWPAGASRLEILDENGLAVHWRIEPNEPSASQEGVVAEFRQILR